MRKGIEINVEAPKKLSIKRQFSARKLKIGAGAGCVGGAATGYAAF